MEVLSGMIGIGEEQNEYYSREDIGMGIGVSL